MHCGHQTRALEQKNEICEETNPSETQIKPVTYLMLLQLAMTLDYLGR